MLLQNGYSASFGSLRFFGAGTINGAYPNVAQSNGYLTGQQRNIFAGEADIDLKSSIPAGARPPVAFQMAQKTGGLASRSAATISSLPTGNAVLGLPGLGSATITLNVSDATGGLIVSGSGSATVSITAAGTILSIASGSGFATVTITAPDALIGAEAGISGSTTVMVTPSALISAVGYMSGLSTNETEFSAAALANAVWQATASSYNDAGTMGEKLNDAGSAGNPWAAFLTANNDPLTFGKLLQDMQTLIDELHKIQGLSSGNPMTVTPTSRTVSGVTLNITGDGLTTSTVTRA